MFEGAEPSAADGSRVARALVAIGIILTYAIGMTVLVAAPLQLLAVASRRCGVMQIDGLHLSACGAPALIAIGAFTLLLSVAIGGWARVVFRHQHFSWPWLAILTLTTVYGVSVTAETMPSAVDTMHSMSGGDSAKAGAFIGFWILMVGYSSHAVWDEARDRAEAYFSARMASRDALSGDDSSRACPHCGEAFADEGENGQER
jgi:hypothetical protein